MAGSLCNTLHAAHAFGVFHCDVKPASIVVREDGTPVLLDLGLPRRVDAEGRGLLRKDERLGNLIAIAPELTQEDASADARTDVYSLATALYCAVSGQPPIQAPTRAEFLREIRSEAPPLLNTLRADAPQRLAEALARAMEKEPARRFNNMLDFAAALKQAVPTA
jgi:serine/threonine-protein kinase